MRKHITELLLVCTIALFAVSPANAIMTGTFTDSWGSTGGGEFIFTPSGDYSGFTLGPFPTFCVETNEGIDLTTTFTVVDFSEYAVNGGANGGPDPLDERTAWLYQSFRDGSLGAFGYDYTPGAGRVASADALQNVFWGIEGEFGGSWTPAVGLQRDFYNAATLYASGLGNVRIMNIAWPDGRPAQSQLALVPAPGAALLAGLGLGLVAWYRRRTA